MAGSLSRGGPRSLRSKPTTTAVVRSTRSRVAGDRFGYQREVVGVVEPVLVGGQRTVMSAGWTDRGTCEVTLVSVKPGAKLGGWLFYGMASS